MSRMVAAGVATADGLFARCGDGWRKLAVTREPIVELTPLGLAVREACAAILAGEVKPCQDCGAIAPCDCERWHEYMLLDPDPHGDLSELQSQEIPY